jgi:hypothetical protein
MAALSSGESRCGFCELPPKKILQKHEPELTCDISIVRRFSRKIHFQ